MGKISCYHGANEFCLARRYCSWHRIIESKKNSLGEMQVPADALYGAQTQRAVENFPISGMKPYPAFVWSMATDQARRRRS